MGMLSDTIVLNKTLGVNMSETAVSPERIALSARLKALREAVSYTHLTLPKNREV